MSLRLLLDRIGANCINLTVTRRDAAVMILILMVENGADAFLTLRDIARFLTVGGT